MEAAERPGEAVEKPGEAPVPSAGPRAGLQGSAGCRAVPAAAVPRVAGAGPVEGHSLLTHAWQDTAPRPTLWVTVVRDDTNPTASLPEQLFGKGFLKGKSNTSQSK